VVLQDTLPLPRRLRVGTDLAGTAAGDTLPGNQVAVLSGLPPGQQVVANALDLQNTADNQ